METRRQNGYEAQRAVVAHDQPPTPLSDILTTLALAGGTLIWTISPDSHVTEPVSAWSSFTGQAPEAAHGLGWLQAIRPGDRAGLLAAIAEGVAAQTPFRTERHIQRADGEWRWMAIHSAPILGADGAARQWVCAATDLTEEREARRAAKRSLAERRAGDAHDAHFERLVATNLIGVVVGEGERIVEANDAFLRMVGYTRADLEAGHVRWRDITQPEYAPLDEQALADLTERGECAPYEKEYMRADGRSIPVLVGATVIDREPLRWVTFVVDLTERKGLEREASERANQLEATLAAMDDGVAVVDQRGDIVQLNAALRKLFAFDARPDYITLSHEERLELLAPRNLDGTTMRPEEWPVSLALNGEDERARTPVHMIITNLAGREVIVDMRATPMYNTAGHLQGVVGVFRDVTEQRRLEREVAEQAAQLRATFEAMGDALFVCDTQGRTQRVNMAGWALLGLDAKEESIERLNGKELGTQLDMRDESGQPLPQERWPLVRALHGEALTGSDAAEVLFRSLDGRDSHTSVSAAPIRDDKSEIIGAVLAIRDVTERRRLEERLRLLANTLESAHDSIFLWELGGAIAFWNRGAEMLYGYSSEEALGRRSSELLRTVPPMPAEEFEEILTREREWSGELVHTARDGRTVTVLNHRQVVRAPDGRTYVFETAHDITDRKELECQREEILGMVAHELGNPLGAMKAKIQLIERQIRRGKALEASALDRVFHSLARIERLVADLSVAESVESSQTARTLKDCDLARLCRDEANASEEAIGRSITLALPAEPVLVKVDRDDIGRVIANLLSNAIKYSPPGRPITLTLAREARLDGAGPVARVSVRDKGPGIAPEAQGRLFTRFYRVPDVETLVGPRRGLGLGLYICRGLVERNGGEIGVESAVGDGSTFSFTLPLVPSES